MQIAVPSLLLQLQLELRERSPEKTHSCLCRMTIVWLCLKEFAGRARRPRSLPGSLGKRKQNHHLACHSRPSQLGPTYCLCSYPFPPLSQSYPCLPLPDKVYAIDDPILQTEGQRLRDAHLPDGRAGMHSHVLLIPEPSP